MGGNAPTERVPGKPKVFQMSEHIIKGGCRYGSIRAKLRSAEIGVLALDSREQKTVVGIVRLLYFNIL